ncbi:aminotransferase class III-fold pyridoxal phosphate-dependent enzyme [Sphingobacterium sp. DK4209]|uniref:Aminotransferase class III-fold pyridoxal phosphate-dependent enzyme n=1 Tax=Sphingobacterium zhuxiongii TaxID=2662364 RepID=A0A5Q0QF34_9SPHI|nr:MULTISPECIES: aspartate aminotransferase family protein [unclassified Sphingobacterium]MVZ65679.1 aminotransferase class III-fold pyridoxal phosphate-dependent enzyme [Sphingobacterium sp. DK4209]QGA27879.1 aminotransferase class III-fold pyridoxal phosphate-dependent enzyme [Sphingobacterium sp. dk4302]
MSEYSKSEDILRKNAQWIPGGVVSLNRKSDPNICFVQGQGSRVVDADGNSYIDYQAGFAASFLGHNDQDVNAAVLKTMQENQVLMGAGPTLLEGEFAELFCQSVPNAESIQITTTGSEATYHAIRIARAATNRDHIIVMQGGYNGWHNDVACNVISSLSDVGPFQSPGEYPFDSLSAGVPKAHSSLVHVVNFNDLDSVRELVSKYEIACILLEPILQNVGIVKPEAGYLEGLRALADEQGFLLIFDEVKTGFRHALGGYQSLVNVKPDLSTFGKAVANGYPLGVIAGKKKYMDYFVDPDKKRRVMIAGTFNAFPMTTAAAIATLKKLSNPQVGVYEHVERLGAILEEGYNKLFPILGVPFHVARQGSAFCVYFMDHAPKNFHDIATNHNFELDTTYRKRLIEQGIFNFPAAIKQGSISFAHTEEDIYATLEATEKVLKTI